MHPNRTQRALGRAFKDVTSTVLDVLEAHDASPELIGELGQALLVVYAVHLACGRSPERSR